MGAKWIAKAIVQKSISFFPNREQLNYLFQRYVTKGVLLDDNHFELKLTHAAEHLVYFEKHGGLPIEKARCLELGTGWYPVVPIAFWLSGTSSVVSIDIQDWMTAERQLTTIRKFVEWHENGKLAHFLPNLNDARYRQLTALLEGQSTKERIDQTIGLETYLMDARKTTFADDHFDYACSNNTFEHVHAEVLPGIIEEFYRVLKPQGLMSHFIDLSDHFAHFDTSITIYNFLRFSQKQWKTIDNQIQPQNRLRWKDYLALYADRDVPVTETIVRRGDLNALRKVPLHAQYAGYSDEELAISHGYILSRK